MKNKLKLLYILLFLLLSNNIWADITGDYKSNGPVTLHSKTNWLYFNGTSWVTANNPPSTAASGNTITIQLNHVFSNSSDVIIASGVTVIHKGNTASSPSWTGSILMHGTYIHNTTGGIGYILNVMTMQNNSTFIYRGSSTLVTPVLVSGKTYYNLYFESSAGTWNTTFDGGSGILTVTNKFSVGSGVNLSMGLFTGSLNYSCDLDIYGSYNSCSFNVQLNKTMTIHPGGSLSVNSLNTLTINGTLNCGNNIAGGNGNFILADGGTLCIGSSEGISSSGASGNIQLTGSRNFSAGANYNYIGSTAQNTGSGLPANVNNLYINNSGGAVITMSNTVTVNGTLTLTSGKMITNSNVLRIGPPGNVVRTSGYVIGNFEKYYAVNSVETSNTFEVGTLNGYSPCVLPLTGVSSAGYLRVNANQTSPPNVQHPEECLLRYWDISIQSGLIYASYSNARFFYLPLDFNGVQFIESQDEATMKIGKCDGNNWTVVSGEIHPGGNNDGGDFVVTDILTSFSVFTAGKGEGSLPVELLSFNSKILSNDVILNWVTENELNNAGFEVFRSSEENSEWIKIGFVKRNGILAKRNNYSYIDKILNTGKYKYCLKQIDYNGNFVYYPLKNMVEILPPDNFLLAQNYPNPFNIITKICYNLPRKSTIKILLYDIAGKEIKTIENGSKNAGYYFTLFNGAGMSSGVYIYKIIADSGREKYVFAKKMVLVK